jgi:SOS-response transcriptional repressor LexA
VWCGEIETRGPTSELNIPEHKLVKGFLSMISDFEDTMDAHNEELSFLYGTFPVIDDAMAPAIPRDADVTLEGKNPYEIGDIVYVEFKNGNEPIVHGYYPVDGKIHLIPDNKRYSPVIVEESDVVITRVDSYAVGV